MTGKDGFFVPSSLRTERMKAVWADSENSHQKEELHFPEGFAQRNDVTCQKPIKPHQDGRDKMAWMREVK